MSVLKAVEKDLREIGKLSPALATAALAASCKVLAAELDDQGNSATSKSMCARALRESMDRLRELTPAEEEHDRLVELRARASGSGRAAA